MMVSESIKPSTYGRAGWIILLVLAVLMALNSLVFGLVGVSPVFFETDTGVAWSQFSGDYPTVARNLDLAERLNGSGYLGTALFAAVVTFLGLRQGVRWTWYALWIVPAVVLLGAVWFFTHNRPDIGVYYVGIAAIASLGLLLSFRLVSPK